MSSGLNFKLDEIVDRIMNNQDILKMLYYTKHNGDVLGEKDLDKKQKRELLGSKIFKHMRLPIVNDEADCYMSMCYGATPYYSKKKGKYIITPTFNIYIICHISLSTTLNGERNLYMIDALNRELHNAKGIGIGEMVCTGFEPILMPSGFVGYMLTYQMSDFEQVME